MNQDNRRARYLLKNTVIFAFGNIATKLISFFLIPLYTNALTAEEYGIADLITTVGMVAIPALTLNICESVMRFALDPDADRQQISRIGTYVLFAGMVLGLLILPICSCFESLGSYSGLIYLYVISLAANQVYMADLRGKELLLPYAIGNILQTFLTAVCNIVFLLVFHAGIRGYILAYILANSLTALYALIVGKGYRSFRLRKPDPLLFKNMVTYSVVLIPNSFMWWIMNASDRIMVTAMVGAAANGIYAISYKLPSLVSTITSIFNQAWSYSAIKEEGASDQTAYSNQILRMLTAFTMTVGIGLMAIAKPFLKIYVSEAYYEAWQYIPFLTIGFVYMTLGTFMGTSYTVHKDSWGTLFSASFGAGMNIVLNFLFIPQIGVYGAAIATCLSYIAVFCFRAVHTRKYMRYHLLTRQFVLGSSLLILTGALTYIPHPLAQAGQFCLLGWTFWIFRQTWLPVARSLIRKISKK